MSTSTMVLVSCAVMMTVLWFLAMMKLRKQENDHIMDMAVMRREYGKDLQSLHEKRQEVSELVKEIGGLETLIKLKDEELNAREGEFEQNWDDVKQYLMEAHAMRGEGGEGRGLGIEDPTFAGWHPNSIYLPPCVFFWFLVYPLIFQPLTPS